MSSYLTPHRGTVLAPIDAYAGVALRSRLGEDGPVFEVALAHADPRRETVLYAAAATDDVIAEWRGWAKALHLPALIGALEDAAERRLGGLLVKAPQARRRRRSTVTARRPSALMRRKPGRNVGGAVHREREIIARS